MGGADEQPFSVGGVDASSHEAGDAANGFDVGEHRLDHGLAVFVD